MGNTYSVLGLVFNFAFVVLQLLFISLYFRIKGVNFRKLFITHIGIGDVLFLFIPATYFDIEAFVLFCLVCYVVSLIVYGGIMLLLKRNVTVPLAGLMAFFLALFITLEQFGFSLDYLVLLYIQV